MNRSPQGPQNTLLQLCLKSAAQNIDRRKSLPDQLPGDLLLGLWEEVLKCGKLSPRVLQVCLLMGLMPRV
jgi:hypothetical protein